MALDDDPVLLVVFDIETTAQGLYSSDVIQLAAVAHTIGGADVDMVCELSKSPWPERESKDSFNAFCRTRQTVSWHMRNNAPGFSDLFNDDRLQNRFNILSLHGWFSCSRAYVSACSPSFEDGFDTFVAWVESAKARHGVDRVWLGGHKIFSSDLPALHAQFVRLGSSLADACTRIGVEAALDSHAIAKDVFSGDAAPRSFALESLFAQTVTPGVTDSKGFIARETNFAWHDARGDVRANLALFLQPAYMQATKAAVPVSALLDHCTRLHDAFTVKAIGKAGKFTPDATTCGTHSPIECKRVGAGNTRGNAGYASKTHTD